MSKDVRVTTIAERGDRKLSAFEIDGEQIAIAALADGYYAFDDVCPHLGCSLSEGELRGSTVICPCHGSEFDVTTGKRLAGPARRDMRTFPVHLANGAIELEI